VTKDVIISLRASQMDVDNEINEIELVTEGKYRKEDNAYIISYDESEVTGMEGTTTTLRVADGVVTLMRSGTINSHFVFQRGHRHISHYDTEFGSFTISVYAEKVDIRINDHGGEIRVGYQMEIENNRMGLNDFHMFIREAGNSNDTYYGRN